MMSATWVDKIKLGDLLFNYFEEIKVVIYLLRQDHLISSTYNQTIKDGRDAILY